MQLIATSALITACGAFIYPVKQLELESGYFTLSEGPIFAAADVSVQGYECDVCTSRAACTVFENCVK
jgi:hypothetical protein